MKNVTEQKNAPVNIYEIIDLVTTKSSKTFNN